MYLKFEDYIPNQQRFEAPLGNVLLALMTDTKDADLARVNTDTVRLFHGTTGLQTEASELMENWENAGRDLKKIDKTNAMEELGDIPWYLAIPISLYPDHQWNLEAVLLEAYSTYKKRKYASYLRQIVINTGKLNEILKKHVFGTKVIVPGAVCDLVTAIMCDWARLCYCLEFVPLEVCEANIRKLDARHGEKFSAERNANRDTNAEMEAMKGGGK